MKTGVRLTASRGIGKRIRRRKPRFGRKPGFKNYQWSNELDETLRQGWMLRGPRGGVFAVQSICPSWSREAIQRRARKLGLKPSRRSWSPDEINLLLHSIGGQSSIASVAEIIKRSENSVRSKLWQLGYSLDDFEGYRPKDLANWFDVPVRQVRYWVERRYVETENHRITESSLRKLLRQRPDLIPFDRLGSDMQFWLRDMGYPALKERSIHRTPETTPNSSEVAAAGDEPTPLDNKHSNGSADDTAGD